MTDVTRNELRNIPSGKSRTWKMKTPAQCASVRVQVSYLNKYEGMDMSVSVDPISATVTVTNNKREINA